MKYWRSWTFSWYRIDGNGSKQVGTTFWWTKSRIGFEMEFGAYELQIMKERT